jgi:hypothetical protein
MMRVLNPVLIDNQFFIIAKLLLLNNEEPLFLISKDCKVSGKIVVTHEEIPAPVLDMIVEGEISELEDVYLECSTNLDQIGSDDDELYTILKTPIAIRKI